MNVSEVGCTPVLSWLILNISILFCALRNDPIKCVVYTASSNVIICKHKITDDVKKVGLALFKLYILYGICLEVMGKIT
jgi:hypothetical protein